MYHLSLQWDRFVFCSAMGFLIFGLSTAAKSKPLPAPWESGQFWFQMLSPRNDVPDFDFSGQAYISSCSGSVVSFGQDETAKAVVLTNAHCVGMLSVSPDTVFRDHPHVTNVRLYTDNTRSINVRSTRILYSTIHLYDLALVELQATYGELAERGVRARRIANAPAAPGNEIILASAFFGSVTKCRIDAIIPFIREDVYRNIDSYKYRGCDDRHGTSGSPLIDIISGEVIGLNYTGNDDGEECTFNNPCEVDEQGRVTVDKGASYGDPVHKILTCLNTRRELDLQQAGCALASS